jgi:hypothetical protein
VVASESRDGNFLYYTQNLDNKDALSDLWKLSLRGGKEALVLRSIDSRPIDVREDGMYHFAILAPNGSSAVRFYDFATGKDREITPIKDFAGGFAVSSDRKAFLFDVRARAGANVMVVDNFR